MKNSAYEQGSNTLVALMEDPILASASNSFKAIPKRKFLVYEESSMEGSSKWTKNNWPYVFQLEYATIGPAFVDVCVPQKKKKKIKILPFGISDRKL